MSNVVELKTRQPTGKPAWPIMLVAGPEKVGKSYAAAEASASDMVGRTLWVGVGEDAPDELGALPGARFEIVETDGTYRGILTALEACAAQPAKGAPNLIVLDSATRLWDLLCDELQVEANRRARVRAEKTRRPVPDEDATITMDQWNGAKQRWAHIMDTLRAHRGPVLITARMENVTVLDGQGRPTTDRTWKVKAEKSLPFDVGCIVEMPARGDTYLAGVRSLRFRPAEAGRTKYPDFTVEKLWRDLGLADKDAATERVHATIDAEDKPLHEADKARGELRALVIELGLDLQDVANEFATLNDVEVRVASAKLLREFIALKTSKAEKPSRMAKSLQDSIDKAADQAGIFDESVAS